MIEAQYFIKKGNNVVKCELCPNNCLINDGKSGVCGARKNINGILYSLNYGVISGYALDPIEKKPLYHYFPGSKILSIGTLGCNLHCPFCQNYHISRYYDDINEPVSNYIKPNDLVNELKLKKGSFNGIAYTYSEPMVWYEFVLECSKLLKENGFKNVLVTNGYISDEPLNILLKYIDAANIDLKAFKEENYRKLGGKLQPVLNNIIKFKEAGVHIELTTLVVTGFNDDINELEELVKWISKLDPFIPFHISRYFPHYKYNKRETDLNFLRIVKEMAEKYLKYVYVGNTLDENNTYCPECGNILIERINYYVTIKGIKDRKCSKCGRKVDIIMD